jgi:superoxide dismutase, Cu-Zn family
MRNGTWSMSAAIGCVAVALLACGDRDGISDVTARSEPPPAVDPIDRDAATVIEVPIAAKSGSSVQGTATLEERPDGVLVKVDLDAAPAGPHGLHFHESADCSAADASSAGEHFNPESEPHGLPPAEARHLGDLGNIEVGEQGGQLEILVPDATLARDDPRSLLERAIVVHAKQDSGAQPSGDAGDRIGCAEIRAAS